MTTEKDKEDYEAERKFRKSENVWWYGFAETDGSLSNAECTGFAYLITLYSPLFPLRTRKVRLMLLYAPYLR